MERTRILIAVAPGDAPWAADAIRRGGGQLVQLDEQPSGLVWTDPGAVEELKSVLRAHPDIAWVQLPMAGIERMAGAGVLDHQRQWTSAKGAYAEPVAEHALALLLAGLRSLPERARAHSWGQPAAQTLFDQPVTIVGGGGITLALLRLLAPFRAPVTVVRRSAEPVAGAARTVTTAHLPEALTGARAVVLTLALTPQTRGIIGPKELELMDRQAWLVNVARGGLVDTAALVAALRSDQIGGAALDVTDPEPLPDGHPLWNAPGVLSITPHVAGDSPAGRARAAALAGDQLARWVAGEELRNVVPI